MWESTTQLGGMETGRLLYDDMFQNVQTPVRENNQGAFNQSPTNVDK